MNTTKRRKLSVDESIVLVEEFHHENGRLPKRGEKTEDELDVGNRLQYMRRRYATLPLSIQNRLSALGVRPSNSRLNHTIDNLRAISFEIKKSGLAEATKANAVSDIAPVRHTGRFLIGLRSRLEDDWTSQEAKDTLLLLENIAFITYERSHSGTLVLRPAHGATFVENAPAFLGAIVEVPMREGTMLRGRIYGYSKADPTDNIRLALSDESGNEQIITTHPQALMRTVKVDH